MVNDLTSKVRQRHMPSRDHGTLPAYLLFVFFVLPCGSFAQALLPSSAELVIAGGTPVKLQLAQTISSAHARNGDRLDFVVVEDVTVGGLTVIRAGTMASGSVIKVDGRRFLGLGGNVIIKLDSVELVTGDRVRLHARRRFKGGSHTKLMAEGMLLAGLIYLPAAPVFLLSHGVDCTVLKGTEVTAYIDGDSRVQTSRLGEGKGKRFKPEGDDGFPAAPRAQWSRPRGRYDQSHLHCQRRRLPAGLCACRLGQSGQKEAHAFLAPVMATKTLRQAAHGQFFPLREGPRLLRMPYPIRLRY